MAQRTKARGPISDETKLLEAPPPDLAQRRRRDRYRRRRRRSLRDGRELLRPLVASLAEVAAVNAFTVGVLLRETGMFADSRPGQGIEGRFPISEAFTLAVWGELSRCAGVSLARASRIVPDNLDVYGMMRHGWARLPLSLAPERLGQPPWGRETLHDHRRPVGGVAPILAALPRLRREGIARPKHASRLCAVRGPREAHREAIAAGLSAPMLRAALARLFAPSSDRAAPPMRLRRFEGAAGGRRLASAGVMPNLAQAGLAARGRLASRARYLVANNALAASGAQAWVTGLVGAGIIAQSQHPDQAVRETINARHTAWVDRADADGVRDLYQLQAAMVRGLVQDGEAFAVMGADPDTGEARVRLHPTRSRGRPLRSRSHRRRHRVRRLRAAHRLSHSAGLDPDRARPRSRVRRGACLQAPMRRGRSEGCRGSRPIILRLLDYDKASDALGMRLQIAAMLCGFVTNPNAEVAAVRRGRGGRHGGIVDGFEPGMLKTLASWRGHALVPTRPTSGPKASGSSR